MPSVNLFSHIVRFNIRRVQMNVRRLLIVSLVLTALSFWVVPVQAATIVRYDFITLDNGMPQDKWAVDSFHSKVTVESLGGNNYRLTFDDSGSTFVTLAAKSPGGDGTTFVAAGINGAITGGEVVVVNGVLKNPLPSHIGTLDFRNDHTPNKYFLPFFDSIASVQYVSWGWKYSTCGNGTWTDNDTTETLYGSVGPNATMGDIKGSPAACQNQAAAPQWFNPDDNRVNAGAGERLVVWCNNPDQIVVYGVNDESEGFLLTTFSNKEVLAAGKKGVSHNLGKMGVVSINEETPTYFWLAWNGGPFGAYGRDVWAKAFRCQFSAQ